MQTKEEKLTEQIQTLHKSIAKFIELAPSFNGDEALVREIAIALANVETHLHWEFGCWELGLPSPL